MGTASNVIVGVAQLFIAPANTDIPAFAATGIVTTPIDPWVQQGFTESGVTLTVDRKVSEIRVEEQSTPVLVVPDTVDVTIDVTFAEDTLLNASTAYGGATITSVEASDEAPATTTLTLAEALTEMALCFVGANPYGLQRLFYVPEVVSDGKVKTEYRRTKNARTYPTTFTALCALDQITWIDATAVAS